MFNTHCGIQDSQTSLIQEKIRYSVTRQAIQLVHFQDMICERHKKHWFPRCVFDCNRSIRSYERYQFVVRSWAIGSAMSGCSTVRRGEGPLAVRRGKLDARSASAKSTAPVDTHGYRVYELGLLRWGSTECGFWN